MRTQAPDSKRPQGGVANATQVYKELCQGAFAKTNKNLKKKFENILYKFEEKDN